MGEGLFFGQSALVNSKLKATPHGLFSWNYTLTGKDNHAELFARWIRERGRIRLNGETLQIRKNGWWSGSWTLLRNGAVIAEAKKSNLFTRTFRIKTGKGKYSLAASSLFTRTMRLKGPGHNLVISRTGIFSRKASLSGQWDDFTLVAFAMWLTVVTWKRRSRSNNNSSSVH